MPKLSISPRARSHDFHNSAKQCLAPLNADFLLAPIPGGGRWRNIDLKVPGTDFRICREGQASVNAELGAWHFYDIRSSAKQCLALLCNLGFATSCGDTCQRSVLETKVREMLGAYNGGGVDYSTPVLDQVHLFSYDAKLWGESFPP